MIKFTKKQRIDLMGTLCEISKIYEKAGAGEYYKSIKISPRAGWITGFSFILNGNMETDFGEYSESSYSYFVEEERIKIIKVRFWTNSKEVNVHYDAIKFKTDLIPYPNMALYSEECKKIYKEQIDLFPRDSKGRFIEVN